MSDNNTQQNHNSKENTPEIKIVPLQADTEEMKKEEEEEK